jgi:hypothetical protein
MINSRGLAWESPDLLRHVFLMIAVEWVLFRRRVLLISGFRSDF